MSTATHLAQGIRLTQTEITAAYEKLYPPILTLKEAAEIIRLSPETLKRHLSEGRYAKCVKRGKPVRIWRDRFVAEVMRS